MCRAKTNDLPRRLPRCGGGRAGSFYGLRSKVSCPASYLRRIDGPTRGFTAIGGVSCVVIQAILFLAFLGAIGLFAVQNTRTITVNFWKREVTGPIALVIVAVYLLGMLSGWTVVAFVRRSLRKVSEQPRH